MSEFNDQLNMEASGGICCGLSGSINTETVVAIQAGGRRFSEIRIYNSEVIEWPLNTFGSYNIIHKRSLTFQHPSAQYRRRNKSALRNCVAMKCYDFYTHGGSEEFLSDLSELLPSANASFQTKISISDAKNGYAQICEVYPTILTLLL